VGRVPALPMKTGQGWPAKRMELPAWAMGTPRFSCQERRTRAAGLPGIFYEAVRFLMGPTTSMRTGTPSMALGTVAVAGRGFWTLILRP
jgi:hypothetical protein